MECWKLNVFAAVQCSGIPSVIAKAGLKVFGADLGLAAHGVCVQLYHFHSQDATVTAALALLPLVLKGDVPGNEIERPLALVILGGLVTSTLLNLFLLPALYARFGRVAAWSKKGG